MYGKAISSLNTQIREQVDNLSTVEETLVVCLLLICYNVLQGNDLDALVHLEGGVQILNYHLPKLRKLDSGDREPRSPIQELAKNFKRLDLQAAWYADSYQIKFLPNSGTPARFNLRPGEDSLDFISIADARRVLDDILSSAFHFMRSQPHPFKYLGKYNQINDDFDGNLLAYQRDIHITQLRHWEALFQRLQLISLQQWKEEEKAHASKIWICYNVMIISLSVSLSPDEVIYDRFLPWFSDIVQYAERFLGSTCLENHRQQNKSLFDLEMSIIQPLYFTALKCRDTDLRSRSLGLLRNCGKEGVWDGDIMAEVAQYVIAIEESRRYLDPLKAKMVLAEQSRICGTAIKLMRSERKVWVQCSTRTWHSIDVGVENETQSGDQSYVWEFCEDVISL